MSEVSNEELEAIYARIDAACERETERCGGDEIEALGSIPMELHDLIALRAALVEAQTQRMDAWEDEDLAKARAETAEERLAAVTAERDTALEECSSLARSRDYGDEMIAATREALGAADDESAVAVASRVTTELAVLRAQLGPLCAVHDALVAAAALPGAGASPEAMVAAVRAQGAQVVSDAAMAFLEAHFPGGPMRHAEGWPHDLMECVALAMVKARGAEVSR